jgi:hypothetical protein
MAGNRLPFFDLDEVHSSSGNGFWNQQMHRRPARFLTVRHHELGSLDLAGLLWSKLAVHCGPQHIEMADKGAAGHAQ